MSFNSPFTGNTIQPTDVSYRTVTMTADTQLQWPINGNATDDYAARIMNVTASTAGLSLLMPPASQSSVGNDALIRNVGSNTFTVKSYAAADTIITVAAGESKYIYITDTSTDAGVWSNIAFGTGTSSADAATLAGYGLLAAGATLNQSHPVSGFTTGYTFLASDRASVQYWTGGTGTCVLPDAGVVGNNYFIMLKNNGTGTITVNTTSSQLIDGQSAFTFNPSEAAFLVSTGSAWCTVGYGQSATYVFTTLTKATTNGTYTLTSSEASNFIQSYTGTLTGNVTVVIPPVVLLLVVSNQTTNSSGNSYTFSIKTSASGANTVTIPSGNQATLISDGTTLLNANTSQVGSVVFALTDGSVSSPSLYFSSEPTTGVYRPTTGQFGVSVLGVQRGRFSATGLTVTGSGTFSTGISGGTF
jgi:hypothetical protein